MRKAVLLNLDNSNTAIFDVQFIGGRHEDDLFDRTVQSTKAVRQAASLYLAFIYDLQFGQLPQNLFLIDKL